MRKRGGISLKFSVCPPSSQWELGMGPAVLAGALTAVLGQEAPTGKVIGEGAARISLSYNGQINPAWMPGIPIQSG